MVLQGVMLLWFIQVLVSVVFIAIDIRRTPESTVMKWGFVVVTLFLGPIGLVLYLLACREPLPGTHEQFVRPLWKQVVGSTMHCVAGDGIGILVAAAVLTTIGVPAWLEIIGEYAVGFLFGWMVFQSLFMRGMAGGSYAKSLRSTLLPEFVSMNGVMAGMVALSLPWRSALGELATPAHPEFWFVMSLSLALGFAVAFPLNWWLVSRGLKHGMMTVRRPRATATPMGAGAAPMDMGMDMEHATMRMGALVGTGTKAGMIGVSLAVLAAGVAIGVVLAG